MTESLGTKIAAIHIYVRMDIFQFLIIAKRQRKYRQRTHRRHFVTVKTVTSIIMARFGRKMSAIITFAKMVPLKP